MRGGRGGTFWLSRRFFSWGVGLRRLSSLLCQLRPMRLFPSGAFGSSTCCFAAMATTSLPRWENQALPVLMPSRSPSPFLREGGSRGRSPNVKVLPHCSQALPAELQPKRTAAQKYLGAVEVTAAEVQPVPEPQQVAVGGLQRLGGQTLVATEPKQACCALVPLNGEPLPASGSDAEVPLKNRLRESCKDLPARSRKVQRWERWLIVLCLSIITIYSVLESQSKAYVEESGHFDYASVEDWQLVWRAGVATGTSMHCMSIARR